MSDPMEPEPKPEADLPPNTERPTSEPTPPTLSPLVDPNTHRPLHHTVGFWYILVAGVLSLFAGTTAVIVFLATPAAPKDPSTKAMPTRSASNSSPNPTQSATPASSQLPLSVTQEIRKQIAEQSAITEDITVTCAAWTPSNTEQKVPCTAKHAGLEISVDLIVHGEGLFRYDLEQTQAFLSAEAVRKTFKEKHVDDQSDVSSHSCDSKIPENSVVEFRKRLPYTCSVKHSYGTDRYAVRVSASGLDFDTL